MNKKAEITKYETFIIEPPRVKKYRKMLTDLTELYVELIEQIEYNDFPTAALLSHDMLEVLNKIYKSIQLEIMNND